MEKERKHEISYGQMSEILFQAKSVFSLPRKKSLSDPLGVLFSMQESFIKHERDASVKSSLTLLYYSITYICQFRNIKALGSILSLRLETVRFMKYRPKYIKS